MAGPRSVSSLCHLCRKSLLADLRRKTQRRPHLENILTLHQAPGLRRLRTFHSSSRRYSHDNSSDQPSSPLELADEEAQLLAEVNARVARTNYGDSLPEGLLSSREYAIYERLYGPPISTFKQTEEQTREEEQILQEEVAEFRDGEVIRFDAAGNPYNVSEGQIQAYSEEPDVEEEGNVEDIVEDMIDEEDGGDDSMEDLRHLERQQAANELADMESLSGEGTQRTHPWTLDGRFGTTPSTIFLPRSTFVDPITKILSQAPNKHLNETADKVFGGFNLPNSVATPSSRSQVLHQKPVALTANTSTMEPMESYAFVAANMAGLYATITNTLVETRKRLGSTWLTDLFKRPGGPRILDAGGAGTGVLAWRDVLQAEWQALHPDAKADSKEVPYGKSTIVTSSNELRERISDLLHDTTFLPRLPDFNRPRDLPGHKDFDPGARKHYDLIVAPHTLWHHKEDYIRKLHVQNLWSLLDPNGGVLIIAEKGVPRGFELVAGARDLLLQYHISSPGASQYQTTLTDSRADRHMEKEIGSIVAPCTNHGTCPMYTVPGEMKGRKDHCHFFQRFIRPPYMQILHSKTHAKQNHEDVRFSYLVVRRGIGPRHSMQIPAGQSARESRQLPLEQDETATLAALEGYEESEEQPPMLALPRLLLPPLKRRRHVTFDVCTPSAQLERWTVPKSQSRQAYHDARKAQWGDLWALGAKTRVLREARAGRPKDDNTPRKRVFQIDVVDGAEGDIIRELNPVRDGKRKGKKGRKEGKVRSKVLTKKELQEIGEED